MAANETDLILLYFLTTLHRRGGGHLKPKFFNYWWIWEREGGQASMHDWLNSALHIRLNLSKNYWVGRKERGLEKDHWSSYALKNSIEQHLCTTFGCIWWSGRKFMKAYAVIDWLAFKVFVATGYHCYRSGCSNHCWLFGVTTSVYAFTVKLRFIWMYRVHCHLVIKILVTDELQNSSSSNIDYIK